MVKKINKLINIFFITFSINFLITIYTIYTFFEMKIFHSEQGSKLKMKNVLEKFEEDD